MNDPGTVLEYYVRLAFEQIGNPLKGDWSTKLFESTSAIDQMAMDIGAITTWIARHEAWMPIAEAPLDERGWLGNPDHDILARGEVVKDPDGRIVVDTSVSGAEFTYFHRDWPQPLSPDKEKSANVDQASS